MDGQEGRHGRIGHGQRLEHQCRFKSAHAGSTEILGNVESAEPHPGGLFENIARNGARLFPCLRVRGQFFLTECAGRVEESLRLFIKVEIHRIIPSPES